MRGTKVVKPLSAVVRETNAERRITPAKVLVLYQVGSAYGQAVAEYYRAARSIPEANVVPCAFSWDGTNEDITNADFLPVLQTIVPHLAAKDILAIVTCGWWPTKASDSSQFPIGDTLMVPHMAVTGNEWDGRYRLKTDWGWFDDYPASYREGLMYTRATACPKPYPYGLLPRKNRYSELGQNTSYVHFRLEVSPSPAGDHITRTTRLIDDAIAAENARMMSLGQVVLGGAHTTYPVSSNAYIDLQLMGATYSACYRSRLTGEPNPWVSSVNYTLYGLHAWVRPTTPNGYTYKSTAFTTAISGTVEPTWPTTIGQSVTDGGITWTCMYDMNNVFPPGDNTLTPGYGTHTPANYTDVFLHFVGQEAYYGQSIYPQRVSDFTYRQGAITGWGMSYSAIPLGLGGIDWDSGTRTLGNITAVEAKSANANIPCTNENGITKNPLYCRYTGGAAAATITVASNTLIFFENTIPVGSVVLSGTLRNMAAQITAALPANWIVGGVSGGAESRTQQSLKAGACIAIGSCVEPFVSGGFKAPNIIPSLWRGEAMGEIAFKLEMPICGMPSTLGPGMTIYGDPLYRPFGHRR